MEKATKDKYIKAGKISSDVKKYARTLLKEGASVAKIADKIEDKIISLGGEIAFPANISVNEFAAHYVPAFGEKTILKKGDLVKVDVGVHIDGFIADTAFSFSVGKSDENEKLISAVNKALEAAIKLAKPNTEVRQIGAEVARIIGDAGLQPIRNLHGHSVDEYSLHAGITIPNYDNGSKIKLKNNTAVAIEPFATTGEGIVIEGKDSETFMLKKIKNVRNGRDILKFISENYQTLPFAKKWLIKKFGLLKTNLFLKEALAKDLLRDYHVLREKTGKKVAQAEHTIIISDKPIILTEE